MSKINCEFDTVLKTMVITVDGKAMDNAVWANFSLYGKSWEASIEQAVKDEKNDTRTYVRLSASEGRPELTKSSVKSDVQKFLEF